MVPFLVEVPHKNVNRHSAAPSEYELRTALPSRGPAESELFGRHTLIRYGIVVLWGGADGLRPARDANGER